MKQVFEKYAKEGAIPTEINGINHKVNIYKKVWTDEEFEQAHRNGDLVLGDTYIALETKHQLALEEIDNLKSDIERARIEAKIEVIKSLLESGALDNIDYQIYTISLYKLETKLKELNNE